VGADGDAASRRGARVCVHERGANAELKPIAESASPFPAEAAAAGTDMTLRAT
jgi:hypothetical protein